VGFLTTILLNVLKNNLKEKIRFDEETRIAGDCC